MEGRTMNNNVNQKVCDESKCLSTGLVPADDGSGLPVAIDNPLLFNCYAKGPMTLYPYLCLDDYVGVRIEDEEAAASHSDLHYYTCCLQDQIDEITPPTRECQDPQEADPTVASSKDWDPTSACQRDSPSFPYGRKMAQLPGVPIAYMCCNVDNDDSSHSESTTIYPSAPVSPANSLENGAVIGKEEDAEGSAIYVDGPTSNSSGKEQTPMCVSFPCQDCIVENNFWDLETMYCYNDFYRYPHIIKESGNTAFYQCCSVPSEDGVDSSFLVTSPAYRATVWTQFTLALVASFMASLLIASIGRSLYLTAKKNNSTRYTNPRRTVNSDYYSYNIYLVFLAIPDLAYNLFMLGIVTEEFLNGWIPVNDALITISATTNQYMNAIIAREVLILLRNTKDCKQYVLPSFQKAGIQFAGVTAFATVLGVLWLYILHYSSTTSAIRAITAIPVESFSITAFYLLVVILPGIYLIWVCFEIWHKELLPKDEVTIDQNSGHQSGDSTNKTEETSQPSFKNIFDKEVWVSFGKAVSNRLISKGHPGPSDPRDYTHDTHLSGSSNVVGSRTKNGDEIAASKPTFREDQTPSTISSENRGRLNVLTMYFFRIILVFFFLWLPGMIMYYMGYETDRNASDLLHNFGLIMFSLQAIVSNGMAFTKPDVKKSICELWEEVEKLCPCCLRQREEVSDTQTDLNVEKNLPEADVEMPIRELASCSFSHKDFTSGSFSHREFASGSFSHASNHSSSRVVTVQHEVANIGGIQVSQLTTHTISSFHSSSSHRGGKDEGDESESDTEKNEHAEFAVPSPRISRKVKCSVSSNSDGDKDRKSDRRIMKARRTSLERQSAVTSSARSTDVRYMSSGGRRHSDPLIAPPSSPTPKKMKKKRVSSIFPSGSSDEEPMRRMSLNEKKSSSGRSRTTRRNSTSQISGSDSPVGKWKNVISSKDILLDQSPICSPMQRTDSGSHVPGVRSPVSEIRKKFDGNDNLAMKMAGVRPAHRRGSGSHLCKLNASNSPIAQVILNSNNNESRANKSTDARPMQRRSSDSNISLGKSPVAQLKKEFNASNSSISKSPIQSPRSKGKVANISITNTSSFGELQKKIDEINDYGNKSPTGTSKRKTIGINSNNMDRSPVAMLKKKFSDISIERSKSPIEPVESRRRNSGSISGHAKKFSGLSTRTIMSSSDNRVGEGTQGESNRRNSGTSRHAKKSPGLTTRKKNDEIGKTVGGLSTRESNRRNSGTKMSPGNSEGKILIGTSNNNGGDAYSRGKKASGFSRPRDNAAEKKIGEPPFVPKKKRNSAGNIQIGRKLSNGSQPIETRFSGLTQISDSSASTTGTRRKRISNSKSMSFDGTVTDNSMTS